MQFLKHSPVFDVDGKIRAVLNIGVLLRASGVSKGDLPGRGDLRLRAQAFQGALLQGMYPRMHTPMIDNMKGACLPPTAAATAAVQKMLEHKTAHEDADEHYTIDTHQLLKRYRLTPLQEHTLTDVFGKMTYGQHLCDSAVDAVLNLDYGLRCQPLVGAHTRLPDYTFSPSLS